ncbi:tetratricopeptide repeat protein [Treponema sp. C6A8]|uniref:tetratricopeptide repeat protein n=1 Tax=Treponema sp. C6A8 TaxID=1410609 RepID=UPI000A978048|nr:tetratricopeptide repeat protein [Treponema sp. C6A8]
MIKNKIILTSLLLLNFCAFVGAQNIAASETALYNEINTAYSTGFLPGVIEKASTFERKYADSAYINEVRLQKARALTGVGMNNSAQEELLLLLNSLNEDAPQTPECYYLLGKAYFGNNLYKNALSSFYLAAKKTKGSDTAANQEIYNQSLLYAGRIYFFEDNFKDSVRQFEYVVSKGNNYSQADFNEALQKLIISYNNLNQGKKSVDLFNSLPKGSFDPQFYYTTAVYAAQGYENIKEYQKAYDLYCAVIDAQIESLSVIALKKAYLLADQKKVPVNPGEVFSRNTALFETQPDLVCDFWIRLGIDEFDAKNYETALDYFANAEKLIDEGVKGDSALIELYRAKIVLETVSDVKVIMLEKKHFDEVFEVFKNSPAENIMDSYYSTLLHFAVVLNNWNDVQKIYANIKKPDAKSAYYSATFFYNKGDYAGVQKSLEDYLYDSECKKMYASSCLKAGNAMKAQALYKELEADGALDEKSTLEYAKALFITKHFSSSYEKTRGVKSPEALYIAGLDLINLRKWNEARSSFNSYISQASSSKDFLLLSFFYKAYAEYNLGEFKNAYASFVRFNSEAESKPVEIKYLRQSLDFAVKSALQNGDFKSASAQAEKLVKISQTKEEKEEAVLLNAQIYADSGNAQKAVDVLIPYTNDKADFALLALFEIAKIYEKQGDLNQAEKNLEKIITKAPRSQTAEDAVFHQGEMYYSQKNYSTAENRFNQYIYKYADGKYSDAALFFCADCNYRLGSYEKAVMLCQVFIKKYDQSIYAYGVYTSLLNAYYDEQDFENALNAAETLIQKYPEQANGDGIGKKAQELRRLVSGTDKTLALKQNEYEKAGKASSKKGRKIGTELVRLYLRNNETQAEGIKLAKELAALQTADDEKEFFAQNTSMIAEYNRKNGENKTAAQEYLEAAAAYRSSGNSEKSAESLYSAAEAFAAAKLMGDARETAATLKELYPQSHYAESVDRITGN